MAVLPPVAMSNVDGIWRPPIFTENGFILTAYSGLQSYTLGADGKLTRKHGENSTCGVTLIKDNLFLSTSEKSLQLLEVGDDGRCTLVNEAPWQHNIASVNDYTTAIPGNFIVVTNRNFLRTFSLGNRTLTECDGAKLAPSDISLSPPVFAHGVVLTTERDKGILHARPLSSNGTIAAGDTFVPGNKIHGGVIVRGNIAIFGCDDGKVYTVRFDGHGKLEKIDEFATGGVVEPVQSSPVTMSCWLARTTVISTRCS